MPKTPQTDAIAEIDGNWDTKALRMGAWARKLEHALRELREAVNPIIDPTVTTLNVDGTLDMINAARKADELLNRP